MISRAGGLCGGETFDKGGDRTHVLDDAICEEVLAGVRRNAYPLDLFRGIIDPRWKLFVRL